MPPARLGIGYPRDLMELLVRAVGSGHAKELLLTARVVDAREALRLGLVNFVLAIVCALNFWVLDEDNTVLGITLSRRGVGWIMFYIIIAAGFLRMGNCLRVVLGLRILQVLFLRALIGWWVITPESKCAFQTHKQEFHLLG